MQTFLFHAGSPTDQPTELERRIRAKLPELQRVSRLEEITKLLPERDETDGEPTCILFPVAHNAPGSFDRMISIASQYRDTLFFIFISDDIPASDYKRLVQTGGADWASTRGAPDEIAEILLRVQKAGTAASADRQGLQPVMVAFLPSAGGVGNSTLAIEVGVQIKTAKSTRNRKVCLLDLDFQNSHVCDYLDIEPRMQIHEIAADPERLDAQLFDLFVSHHKSGLDVLAAPRSKAGSIDIHPEALESLFQMMAARYDLILLDFPVPWFSWTNQLISATEVVLVTGSNTIPGLRQASETLKAVKAAERVPPKVAVVLNRCEHRLLSGFARQNHVKNLLGDGEIFFVRDDTENVIQSVNTGIPMVTSGQGGKVIKDIEELAKLAASAKLVPATKA